MTVEIHLWAAPVAERLRALDQLIAVSAVGSSPALATCETRQVLIAGVPGSFSRGSPVFAYILIGPSHMSRNNLERDVKLKKNYERNVPDLKSISASFMYSVYYTYPSAIYSHILSIKMKRFI